MKFRQNEFYAIEGHILNILINSFEDINEPDCCNANSGKTHNYKTILNRILAETIELDCQENNCSFNKERGDK